MGPHKEVPISNKEEMPPKALMVRRKTGIMMRSLTKEEEVSATIHHIGIVGTATTTFGAPNKPNHPT